MKTALNNFFKGIIIGIANIIPGVSGGTIAVVLGIFDQLIYSVNSFYKDFKKCFIFLAPVGLGAMSGIVAFSTLIEYLLETHSFEATMFFVGLIVGSLPLIYKKTREREFKLSYISGTVLAIAVVVSISLFREPGTNTVPESFNLSFVIKMFLSGALASAAMITPGISGSFIMILLGVYHSVIQAISGLKTYLFEPYNFDLLYSLLIILIPLGLGVILGIILISKLMTVLLDKAYSLTYSIILGLVLGSIFGIFNDPLTYQSGVFITNIVVGIITLAMGFLVALFLGKE